MTVLVCGDRNWTEREPIRARLEKLGPGTVIVHGDARGADKMAGAIAERLGYHVIPHPADWEKYGKAAGPIRNAEMIRRHPDLELVLAFHDNLAISRGTRDMVVLADKKGIPVEVINSKGQVWGVA